MNLEYIAHLSEVEKKSILERMIKLQEEVGELAQEILISQKSSGLEHKTTGKDGIPGECVDVILVALSIFFKTGHSQLDLEKLIESKSKRWEKFQNNS